MNYAKFSKINSHFIITSFVLLFVTLSFSQVKLKTTFTANEINNLVIEVFQEEASHLVFNPNSNRMKLITNFFNKQFTIKYSPEYSKKKFKHLSSLGVNNKYNKNLKPDQNYDPKTFNPLKYNIPLGSKSKEMYRIGHTNYIISIKPLN